MHVDRRVSKTLGVVQNPARPFDEVTGGGYGGVSWVEWHLCHGQGCRVFLGMVVFPPLKGILIMGPYKPLRNWVDEFIPYYMEIMGV